MLPARSLLKVTLIFPLALAGLLGLASAAPDRPARPRLAVLLFFDQLRGDYLTRWDAVFGDDGFRRLEREGAWFQNCHYPYAYTVTGAGHASVAAGCSPYKHGIVGNDWYERAAGDLVNCVASDRHAQVPAAKKARGVSAERLLQPTLADALKEATGGKGKVVSLSLKDRSAALPGGRRPDACYWADAASGAFVTSTYYRDRPHPWVDAFNRGGAADRWRGRAWERLRPDLDYARHSGPDDTVGEGPGVLQGRTFPHPFPRGGGKLDAAYCGALATSPFGNDLLLDLAKRAVVAERLGEDDIPDLLSLSFSSNDLVGHAWGPDSQEVLDVTLRSDLIVKDLLAFLDEKVGRGRYTVVLTADHGVCPLPEVSRKRGKDARRVLYPAEKAEDFLKSTFGGGPARWLEAAYHPWLYLNREVIDQRGLKGEAVEEALARWLRTQPGVQAAYTRSQLLRGVPPGDEIGRSVLRSFHPERCGDVGVVTKPYYYVSSEFDTGTGHGTPHAYDTHVPLLVHGPGVLKGVRREAVTPLAAAAILAAALGIPAPAGAEAKVPEGLFEGAVTVGDAK